MTKKQLKALDKVEKKFAKLEQAQEEVREALIFLREEVDASLPATASNHGANGQVVQV